MRLTVGEIADVLGVTKENVRYYVREGLITPRKNAENNYWEYSTDDAMAISDILFYRDMNVSIGNIRRIFNGLDVTEIGSVIDETAAEVRAKIEEYTAMLTGLEQWKQSYETEIDGLDTFTIGRMPAAFRVIEYYDESDHIANYLRSSMKISRSDWCRVSLSFFCNIHEEPLKLRRYMSVRKEQFTESFSGIPTIMEESHENCVITYTRFSENVHEMVDPLLRYAREQGLSLTGELYGREHTNYFEHGKRNGIYKLYAPLKEKNENN